MHGLGYIQRSNARAAESYSSGVIDAAKAEIDRLKGELSIALMAAGRLQAEADDASARVVELERRLSEARRA